MNLKQALELGFDEFMDSASEGWSFVAVKASAEQISQALQRRVDVVEYSPNAAPQQLVGHPVLFREQRRRCAFLLKLESNPWTILLRTVDWIRPEDAIGVRRMAAELSSELQSITISSVGAYDGAECRVFENGEEIQHVDTDDLTQDFVEFCDQQELAIPGCFIGGDEHDQTGTLYIQDIPLVHIERLDRFVLQLR